MSARATTWIACGLAALVAACGDGQGSSAGPAGSFGKGGAERPASPTPRAPARVDAGTADYVDSTSCAECHATEWEQWVGSHHDLAMQEATEATVLGDFEDAVFEHLGVTTRFFRRDGGFFVNAEGPDGAMADFEVRYTFGVEPLQQYLIAFPNGALQCLTVAWDSDLGRWFDLYPDERVPAGDALHWTGRYQRWNAMCAECHSTQLEKNYDVATDSYTTTWHEIDVGCQACHGPGGDHVAWAREHAEDTAPGATLGWREVGLTTGLRRAEAQAQLDACAPCHSRRSPLNPDYVHGQPFLDSFAPELLRPGLYHADGQILDEVYVYGSFVQSKMHAAGVACTDCHNPHSLEPLETGDALCMQCHSEFAPLDRFPTLKAKNYRDPAHHGHPLDSEGARCVACHMPERTYMVIDERRDHSFRIPRPDLSASIGTPNACNDCHTDETPEWAVAAIDGWREGDAPAERPAHYGEAFAGAQRGDPESFVPLVEAALDPEQPAIVRATALDFLRNFGPDAVQPAQALLTEEDTLVRTAAVRGLDALSGAQKLQAISVAEDEALMVQVEAGRVLAEVLEVMAGGGGLVMAGPVEEFRTAWGAAVEEAYGRYITAQELSADLPSAHLNLGVLYEDLGRKDAAETAYERALAQDPAFLLARFNLATLLNRLGRNRSALAVLSKGLEYAPDEGELHYSLGLLQAEMGDEQASAESLLRAAARLPGRRGVHRNAGLALQRVGRTIEAEQILMDGARLYPDDPGLQHALAYLFAAEGDRTRALGHARRLRELDPESPPAEELVERMLEDLGR